MRIGVNRLPLNKHLLESPCAIRAVVLHKPIETRIRKGMTLYKTSVTDGMRDLQLTFFNNPYIVNTLTEGKEYIFTVKYPVPF